MAVFDDRCEIDLSGNNSWKFIP